MIHYHLKFEILNFSRKVSIFNEFDMIFLMFQIDNYVFLIMW